METNLLFDAGKPFKIENKIYRTDSVFNERKIQYITKTLATYIK